MAIPIGFPTFSRASEREAEHLGLQYMYRAGYDPTVFVDFFEKIESMEKKKPGTVAKVFSTHPMTGLRRLRMRSKRISSHSRRTW